MDHELEIYIEDKLIIFQCSACDRRFYVGPDGLELVRTGNINVKHIGALVPDNMTLTINTDIKSNLK